MKPKHKIAAGRWLCAILVCWLGVAYSAQVVQGVSKSEIDIGTIQDLSGPMSVFGKQLRNGLKMRAEEINDQGGVNGRRLKLFIEDSSNDPKRAALAAERLALTDHVFAILAHMGAAQNLAAMPVEFKHNVINFLPLSATPEVYEPPSRLKMAFWPSYSDQVRTAIPYLVGQKKLQRVCLLYEDDAFGEEVLRGTQAALRSLNLGLVEKASFRSGETNFAPQIAKLRLASCELVVLATVVSETVAAVGEARKDGFNPDFVGTSALYSAVVHTVGGKAMDGLYGVHTVSQPYADDASKLVRDWTAAYRVRFHEDPGVFAVYGYAIMDLFAKAAAKAGPSLTVARFNAAMEATTFPRDMFGSPEFHITATDRLGSRKVRISQIINSKWVPVSTLLDPPPG